MMMRRWRSWLLAVGLALWAGAAWAADENAEAKIGQEAAAQIEKEAKVADAPEEVARLEKIIGRLVPHTQRPQVKYVVKVLQSNDINAFALPGGHVYVTQGTLKAVESEDELAAVLAHEMAHNCRRHGMQLLSREARLNAGVGLAMLAAVLAGKDLDPGNVMVAGGLLKTAILNGYSVEAEYEADQDGVLYMYRSGYNPVAMLTVMEGFARLANTRPYMELGIFQTHPYPVERAERLVGQLRALGVPINRRLVTHSLVVKVKEEKREGRPVGQILVDAAVVFETAVGEKGGSATERAAEIGDRLSRQILDNLQSWEIQAGKGAQDPTIYARGEPLIQVLPEDAALQDMSQSALAREVFARLQMAFWKESVTRAH